MNGKQRVSSLEYSKIILRQSEQIYQLITGKSRRTRALICCNWLARNKREYRDYFIKNIYRLIGLLYKLNILTFVFDINTYLILRIVKLLARKKVSTCVCYNKATNYQLITIVQFCINNNGRTPQSLG